MTKPGEAVLVPVLSNHRFDEAALARYLSKELPGFRGPMTVRQFQGGQSNPTFHLATPGHEYVLRKKPSGNLLASAHAVDREFAVQRALAESGVPVPKVHLLCTDESVIGQMFYVMDHLDGRIFTDRLMPGSSPAERAAIYDDMNRVLAALHGLDFRALGLSDFGRPEGYVARQIARWSKQYAAAKINDLPAMDRLIEWLRRHAPAEDESAISHGDFRLGNLMIHPTEPRVIAVLDWELATIGHPLADLAYNCLSYRLPYLEGRGFGDVDLAALGIPSEKAYVDAYCRRTGRGDAPFWEFFLVLSMFRTAAIQVGIHRRAIEGNASDARALKIADIYTVIADRAWQIAAGSEPPR